MRDKLRLKFLASYKQLGSIKEMIRQRVQRSEQVGNFEDFKEDLEDSLGMNLSREEILGSSNN